MKKFLSMVMAAAMVVSLVPATAFAASNDVRATAKVVNAKNYTQDEIEDTSRPEGAKVVKGPELQLYYTTADYATSDSGKAVYTVTLDNAEFSATKAPKMYIKDDNQSANTWTWQTTDYDASATFGADGSVSAEVKRVDDDEIEITVDGKMNKGWTLGIDLESTMDKTSKGKTAKVSVDSDDVKIANGDDLVYASVEAKGIKASVKDTVDIAVEEVEELKEIKVEPTVGSNFSALISDVDKAELTLRLPSGYEFSKKETATSLKVNGVAVKNAKIEDDEIVIPVKDNDGSGEALDLSKDVWKITGLKVEAASAKAGSTGTVRISLTGSDTVTVEAIKVVEFGVIMSVDEDEDVPVIYSGVNVKNEGITDDSDHKSLEVTIKETFVGAFDSKKELRLTLPEGVYVANDKGEGVDTDGTDFLGDTAFQDAYKEGEHTSFVFEKRSMKDSDDEKYETTFSFTLVADPNFEGDVVLTMEGDGVETQKVTIAKFVKPFTVEAKQNDLQIAYRNTDIPTDVVIKEAEAGLWDQKTDLKLALDKIAFDDDAKVTVDSKSGLEIKNVKTKDGAVSFEVDKKSGDEPAVVTISGLTLFMDRSLPAGAYDLKVASQKMLGIDVLASNYDEDEDVKINKPGEGYLTEAIYSAKDKDDTVADVNDDSVSYVAKAGFVNIITAGPQDTESFTTKVVVPVGEKYIISGENKVEIDVPAYINANGYTMLPLRAVSVALGIKSDNVLWDQATRTATIMYGNKIINMTYGQKVMYVNGAMIPATAAVEIKDNRMFLGMRDLGNALGVTDITWDQATKTATLNGSK
ncbi:copper amine oxidase N-terminal domain-containing protein [Anaerotignum sp.]|uniref:copper amine oxidase N-terminal domain-containing protein n=1 Tax=Anaerotignum sp. TaxID=2039241 RepID=UPI002A90AD0C|nr:copper amine oxidase N-terminal domain-containing protein [Anaerotignum sp.]MCI7658119.1 copper amine oxidase N-terminal domain-containing protein [Clostridia bacterium]MDY5414563.1 copper amine oxidase N-terminal domain-containing protein [Anaerotignum sp.]